MITFLSSPIETKKDSLVLCAHLVNFSLHLGQVLLQYFNNSALGSFLRHNSVTNSLFTFKKFFGSVVAVGKFSRIDSVTKATVFVLSNSWFTLEDFFTLSELNPDLVARSVWMHTFWLFCMRQRTLLPPAWQFLSGHWNGYYITCRMRLYYPGNNNLKIIKSLSKLYNKLGLSWAKVSTRYAS